MYEPSPEERNQTPVLSSQAGFLWATILQWSEEICSSPLHKIKRKSDRADLCRETDEVE